MNPNATDPGAVTGLDQFAAVNFAASSCDGTATAGRKGIAYDWQSLLAANGVAAIETKLSEMVLESAE